jgi:hypothetical protein
MSKRKRFSARRSAALYGIVYEASMQMRIEVLRGRASRTSTSAAMRPRRTSDE